MTPSSAYSRLARQTQTQPTQDPCTPCPVCGGLQCLCRPRFFAGQLLTEADLNRLDHYIVEKNKLHNRYIHGWGVACGLEVVCHPCDNQVLVKPGYALSPCGDDIVVCRDETVDLCALILGCCRPEPDECAPERTVPPQCQDLEQEWVLAICYDEKPTRGMAALHSTPSCSPRCSCGGSGSCGCGGKSGSKCSCGSSGKSSGSSSCGCSGKSSSAKRPTVSQCEPTVVCESYHFIAYPAPRQGRDDRTSRGAMFDRYLRCLQSFITQIPPVPTGNFTTEDVRRWCCDVRSVLVDVFASNAVNCELLSRLGVICAPAPAGVSPQVYLQQVVQQLLPFLVEVLRGCLCSALLPPCPEPVDKNCVPLATITIRRRDCRILRICNLENRKFLTTFPNLQYWLSWAPYVRNLRAVLERLCCPPPPPPPSAPPTSVPGTGTPNVPTGGFFAAPDKGFRDTAAGATSGSTFTTAASANQGTQFAGILANAFRKRSTEGPKGIDAFASHYLGLRNANGQAFVSDLELENPLQAALADELILPLIEQALPAGGIPVFLAAGTADAARYAEAEAKRESEVADLRSKMDSLQQTVLKQQATIDGLIRNRKAE